MIGSRTETVIDDVAIAPLHPVEFFRELAIPADLPVFRIRGELLEGSSFPEPVRGGDEQARLDEIVARVRAHELRYSHLEARVRIDYQKVGIDLLTGGDWTAQSGQARSVLRNGMAFFSSRATHTTLDGTHSAFDAVNAFDGEWTRTFNRTQQDSNESRAANGLTVIGIHPPGSERAAIKKVMDEFHLGYATCIDVLPGEGASAWGDLFAHYAVRAIPHAVAVDASGTIVACGALRDVVATASRLVEPKQ